MPVRLVAVSLVEVRYLLRFRGYWLIPAFAVCCVASVVGLIKGEASITVLGMLIGL